MLNIPETVKTLFKADGIRKNFRVQFPDGELPDITNENIVQESVKFTESLCSQDVLKFGLTEASVIEFETGGVANMYGMTIECGIEIDLSSLSASEIAEIAAGSWDGVYVSETDTDIGFPFFRVPYGIFRVESCPRDHQAMTHRRVQAYALTKQIKDPPIELGKLASVASYSETYVPDVEKLLYAAAGWVTPEFLGNLTKTQYKTWTWFPQADSLPDKQIAVIRGMSGGSLYTIRVTLKSRRGAYSTFGTDTGDEPSDELYALEIAGTSNVDASLENVSSRIDTYGAPLIKNNKDKILAVVRQYIQVNFTGTPTLASDSAVSLIFSADRLDIPVFYPFFGNSKISLTVLQSASVELSLENVPSPQTLTASVTPYSNPTLYKFSGFESTIKPSIQPTGNTDTRYSYTDAYSINDYVDSYLEMLAYFGKTERSGAFTKERLTNASAAALTPGDYSGFWWDEYDVLPIGTVKYSFRDTNNNETVVFYQIGSGGSLYDMTKNEIIKDLGSLGEEGISDLLAESFVPHIGPIAFTPIDLDMKGLPYLEAGDYLAVTAEDGVIAYSFAMRQEISGVQVLQTHIESTSGDIIESEASE